MCNHNLQRRTSLLKHLDNCKGNKLENNLSSSSTVENLICELCNSADFHTLKELENHLWNHVNK